MIFLTVGTQLPFDRLITDMDALAGQLKRKIVGQIGISNYRPENFEYSAMLHPVRFDELCQEADIIVSHAGIGSILTAQKYQKPVVIVPRLARFGEHRNDHQLATCDNMKTYKGVYPASSREQLLEILSKPSFDTPSIDQTSRRRADFIAALGSHLELISNNI